jgi:hypothetical protein
MRELKPCPFCGSEAEIWQDEDNWWCIGCSGSDRGCPVAFMNAWRTEADAIEAWNRRAK